MLPSIPIGIDLGTTNSVIAFFNNNTNNPEIIENEQGQRITPSFVYFHESGDVTVGTSAKDNKNPQNGIFDIKRIIGRNFTESTISTHNYPYKITKHPTTNQPLIEIDMGPNHPPIYKTPEEISAEILKTLKISAQNKLGDNFQNEAVITVPAYFNHAQRQATLKAAQLAGLKVIRLLNEPSAAALAYIHSCQNNNNRTKINKKLVVFDFGGGTFDVSILQIEDRQIQVLGIDGDSLLGGKDIDDVLVNYVINKIKQEWGEDVSNNRRTLRRIRSCCQDVKVRLSSNPNVEIVLDYLIPQTESITLPITRLLFNTLAHDIFQKTLNILHKALVKQSVHPTEIDQIILIGGSSRIPKIEELLTETFRDAQICKKIGRDEGVALGAAIYTAQNIIENNFIVKNFDLVDVLSFSLGVNVIDDKFSFILRKNDVLPCRNSKVYKTVMDDQTFMELKIFEGEEEIVFLNSQLGELLVEGLTEAKKGEVRVVVEFQVDQNGVLNIEAWEEGKEGEEGAEKKQLTIQLKNRYD